MATKKLQIIGELGSNIELDSTLTQQGLAADAKATGDAIKEISDLVGDTSVSTQISSAVESNVQPQIDTLDEGKVAYTDSPVFAADDSVDTTLEVINADTLGGMTPEYFATAEMVNNLTYSDVDAAPAGYGLGGYTERVNITNSSELDSIVNDGWYGINCSNKLTVGTYSWQHFTMFVSSYNADHTHQEIRICGKDFTLCRDKTNRVWGEWEWVNPPMVSGVEYRTTERWNSKVVYAKRIDYTITETLGNTTGLVDTNIPHGVPNYEYTVRCYGKKSTYTLPIISSIGGSVSISQVSANSIVLRNYKETSAPGTFMFDLYYTKY